MSLNIQNLDFEIKGNPGRLLTCNGRGDGQTALLFIHGFMGQAEDWLPIFPLLSESLRPYALTLPGHGDLSMRKEFLSDPQVLRQWFDGMLSHIPETRIIPVAYSMGGRVLLHTLSENMDRYAALILESVSPGIEDPDERMHRAEDDRNLARFLTDRGMTEFLERWYGLSLFSGLEKANPQEFQEQKSRRLRLNPDILQFWLRDFSPGRIPAQWSRLTQFQAPVLYIAGMNDKKYLEIGERIGQKFPQTQIRNLPDCGHNCHLENPTLFIESVNKFIREAGL